MNIVQNIFVSIEGLLFVILFFTGSEGLNSDYYFSMFFTLLAIIAFCIIGPKIYGKKKN